MKKLDLAGVWNLTQSGKNQTIPIKIPGDNFSALIESGKIPHSFLGRNELDTLWVGREDWVISRAFTVDGDLLRDRQVFLHIESLDTWAEIRINGQRVAESNNMFQRIRTDVGDYLQEGANSLEILIFSPEKKAAEVSRTLKYNIPYSIYPVQSAHRNLIRKVQCHSGWDWGPCLMVSGIYGEIYLASTQTGRLECIHTNQRQRGEDWDLETTLEFLSYIEGEIALELSLGKVSIEKTVSVNKGLNILQEILRVNHPELWWPAGYGEQSLYTLQVKAGEDEITKRIGFRTIEVLLKDDKVGRSMTFAINGREIFCKGANWIPMDALPSQHTKERYEALLSAAVEANMNMIRVWGGGQYESEEFYRICDENGLFVWQDFMFSCAMYPATRNFLSNVEKEIVYQVKRLKDHPCIALWCGNNENVGALNWFEETKADLARYLIDYDRLNEGVVGRIVKELDPNRTWWPSSPSAGEGDYSDNWHNDSRGDMHYWSVWHGGKPFESYYDITPRFCSEFGFQSFPSLSTVASYADKDQQNITSPVMEHHQRHPRGNTVIISTLSRYFRFPEKFEHFLYLSQVQQALAMKTAVEYWRSKRPVCMGALYWQLNDNWPVASWSSIEYSGKWKLLHYVAKRFYQPIHLAVYIKDNSLQVWGLNDTEKEYNGKFQWRFLDFYGSVQREGRCSCKLNAEASTRLLQLDLDSLDVRREECFFLAMFECGSLQLSNDLFLALPKECNLILPKIDLQVARGSGMYTVTLNTDRPAFYVSLDAGNIRGIFSDNCFTLLPGESKIIEFAAGEEIGSSRFKQDLTLYHLRDTYTQ